MNIKSDSIYRFAPSPTGFLHVGGARTAIYNWLLARNEGGKFLLRIEDSDQWRSTAESVQQIMTSLRWLGLEWDAPPLFQSTRFERYRQVVEDLLKSDRAYYCFCPRRKGEEDQSQDKPVARSFLYDGRCRKLNRGEVEEKLDNKVPAVIRIKLPPGVTRFIDGVHGEVVINNSELDDFVLMRSDQTPVYQLAVVVDDHDMGITHVLRGDDHLSNTPKQIHIYRALDWQVPQFSHLPLILGADKQRLSKRHGATSVEEFQEQGILPEALLNYLCLLGWSPGDDTEIMSREELIIRFSLKRINKGNAVFDQQKLWWMNSKYLAAMSAQEILEKIAGRFNSAEIDEIEQNRDSFLLLIELLKPRSRALLDFIEGSRFYFIDPQIYEEQAVQKYFTNSTSVELLGDLTAVLRESISFKAEHLEKLLRGFAAEQNKNAGQIIHPLRLALTGRASSPGIFEVLEVLGREKTVRRLNKAMEFMRARKN